jgi:NAD(P)H-dependent FMN reductase
VSYGGAAGGSRAAQGLKQVTLALKMEPLYEGLVIASPRDQFDEADAFQGTDTMRAGAETMLNELAAAVERRRALAAR